MRMVDETSSWMPKLAIPLMCERAAEIAMAADDFESATILLSWANSNREKSNLSNMPTEIDLLHQLMKECESALDRQVFEHCFSLGLAMAKSEARELCRLVASA